MTAPVPVLTDHFAMLASVYDVVLSDVWGVVHNGLAATPPSCQALTQFRAEGGTVVLISNAPRPGEGVIRQIGRLGVPREAYDDIVTSGDVTRAEILGRPGQSMHHIGPERDLSIFAGLPAPITPIGQADYVVCTGLVNDEVETPEDYRALLDGMLARRQPMICGNPDVVVERGERLVYCAGAVADLYVTMGGDVLYAGKPHRPIYDTALGKAAAARGRAVDPSRVLAIGDSVRTDVTGARTLGLDCLFVTAGIHAEELGDRDNPDLAALGRIFTAAGVQPRWVTRRVAW